MKMEQIKRELFRGWNTWNTGSVLSHVLAPQGFSVTIGLKDFATRKILRSDLIGRFGEDEEHIHPGMRSYDGRYTELRMVWNDLVITVRSTVLDGEQIILIVPEALGVRPPALLVECYMLWNRPGIVGLEGDHIRADLPEREVTVYASGKHIAQYNTGAHCPYLAVELSGPVVVSTGEPRALEEVLPLLDAEKRRMEAECDAFGDLAEAYGAMRTCLAWDTIYEPEQDFVCTPVSRIWNQHWGGYVLFCWDTFFAAMMAGEDNKALAYSNVFAILNQITERGFVPNFGAADDQKSRDRSQPPVGSLSVLSLYKRYGDRWLAEETFDRLYRWNSWFYEHRSLPGGSLTWGSDPFEPVSGCLWETEGVGDRFGAALESGLDNSPMYDDIPFDRRTNLLNLADVGLTGLYIMDCGCLAELADILGREAEGAVLRKREKVAESGLSGLWDADSGMFCNRRTDTGAYSHRLSPTNFYALYSGEVTEEQAGRMLKEHFYNPDEFWGDYIMPSIARNDPAYPDQDYWRGRIWAPMNFLVYLALDRAGQRRACGDLAEKSLALFLKEWRLHGHVHENYCGDTGMGCGVRNSDKFYHWGALLAYIALLEKGRDSRG